LTSAYLRRAVGATDEAKASADYLGAVRAGETLTRLRSDEESLGLYARALFGAKQYARAALALERAAASPNASATTLYLYGLANSRANNFPKAVAALERAVAKSPADLNVYRELGYDYEKTKQYAKAFALYQKALETAPNDADFKEALERVRPFANQ
jgi:tetratricopeptide (TPR) repeat protein